MYMSFSVAVTNDDPIIKQIFFDAGEQLGKHVMALVPRVDQVLLENVIIIIY